MGTRLTHHRVYSEPGGSIDIPHMERGWCQVVNAEFSGGGGEQRWLLDVIALEPYDDSEGKAEDATAPRRRGKTSARG